MMWHHPTLCSTLIVSGSGIQWKGKVCDVNEGYYYMCLPYTSYFITITITIKHFL